ncbi:protein of unknown function DUF437 [Pseudopedobacter saltans DSM 12145]|uniref:ASCH domain-containing protein n=1 Tax=Pseudopedobacter saltans (strain ATCC 51119 / DSM 12145 / JCM 21818 / CCUG 39354 / LMG 10337 / NBRC 100064 / NCIMB 13643) TaxID=762903 RepID=F0SAU3_PSESL|nr:ASCH domain-containing protein [Pseudopedobacter saltans]ADY51538.1 protein of unknown function DUF437 [Pseudopedobacter saltans DSM 12145]
MKTLTIKQPWASLIANGIKDVENRSWKTNYRGEILIHAGLDTVFDGFMPDGSTVGEWLRLNGYDWHYNNVPHGAIIGKANLVDCTINHSSIWAEKSIKTLIDPSGAGFYHKPTYNWVFEDAFLFPEPLLNVRGKLSLWDWHG